ncbi:polysaccharide deacetylase family protein [Streptosporangium sp. CA-135522]|uniref:polysaccharide deacetylase family protein n=1 Tax=Streptosporangium sp. CA-135522 TaxID=3240072 RepID=UPI003D8E0CEE
MKVVRWMAVLSATPVVLAILQPASHAESAESPKARTVVSLTFDDGDKTHVAAARILEKRGMLGTFYVNSDTIGRERKLDRRQLAAIAKAGHEIGGHTLTHARLTELPESEQRVQICDDRRALAAWGYRPATLAYPFGSVDDDAKSVARQCGYDAARRVGGLKDGACRGCPAAEDPRPKDRYEIRTPGSVHGDTLLRQLKQQVLNTEKSGGGFLPLVFHRVCGNCGLYSVAPRTLEDFLDWLATRESRGTVVKTFQDAVGARYRPLPPQE